ncbi:hypothetical protein KNU64_gp87 [Gordonia Phage Lollipop1437]|uniref:Uncharacterized protein n=1 Tax=Gordonia Phage Lollipop1437 TaxID=2588505 RepID=A0A4Y6EP05_9CAUD|nr:hypothetical protein KNU64_gp87 [Gordonia Phage Lollipop1437]QDF19191.1 hypothetical protein SEA_LOLLIPOP1437_87 [Gordonia Phage Lollipop1437]
MRFHTDTLTGVDLFAAVSLANDRMIDVATDLAANSARKTHRPHIVTPMYAEITTHGSRIRTRALEVQMSGDASRRTNSGNRGAGDDFAATWDQWGLFLAEAFRRDPGMLVGSRAYPIYDGAAHFHWVTGGRYADLTTGTHTGWKSNNYHRAHRWGYSAVVATGAYSVSECTNRTCTAIVRRGDWSAVSG